MHRASRHTILVPLLISSTISGSNLPSNRALVTISTVYSELGQHIPLATLDSTTWFELLFVPNTPLVQNPYVRLISNRVDVLGLPNISRIAKTVGLARLLGYLRFGSGGSERQ